jgi:ATP-dependent phosphofructokinase / diphosphate-dependent phosphofructokinase
MVRRIAVGQGGGPTPVINDSLAGIIYEAQLNGLEIIGLRNGLEGGGLNPNIPGNLVDLSSVESYFLRGIPGAYLGTTRMKLSPEKPEDQEKRLRIASNMDKLGVDMLFYVGGNDSAETLRALGRGIHVAKTVDNDLPENDHTPGFGSACLANSEIIRALVPDVRGFSPRVRGLGSDIYSPASVVVYQAQGRNTGWLSLGCAFAKLNHAGDIIAEEAPHLFLIREIPYNRDNLLGKVDDILRKRGFAFVVCGEELVCRDGKTLHEVYGNNHNHTKDSFGNTEHARSGSFNCANFIASEIKAGLKKQVESISDYSAVKETPFSPNHIQRTLRRSLVDAQEAFEAGREAVRVYLKGEINCSIALQRFGNGYNIRPVRVSLESVSGKVRSVEQKYHGTIEGPTELFYQDFLPLFGGPLEMSHYVGPGLENFKI